MSLLAIRERMPLIALILLGALFCALACLCISDHPAQALQRFFDTVAAQPTTAVVWSLAALCVGPLVVLVRQPTIRPRSPALLQRFLF